MRTALAAASALVLATTLAAQSPPTLTIHADQPGHAISPHLHGIFFEEINHAGEGGIYAQLLRNPTFEEPASANDQLPGWSLVSAQDSKAQLSRSADQPHAAATPNFARVDMDHGTTTLQNRGHFGVPLRDGEEYAFAAFVRTTDAGPATLTLDVVDPAGHEVLAGSVFGLDGTWREVTFTAKAAATVADGTLRVHLAGKGRVDLDTATLRPTKTWKNHGLRQDLAELLANLRPAFVRFPGGCYVEGGDKLADAFRWPFTLGPLQDRPGHRNVNWNYWSADGLGFHEYLQLCEDLGAAPMYVANCGMSHKEFVPADQLQPWIQECLDAIEYANGDITTPQGKRRAAAGHEKPFGLRYLEIGNENGMFGSFGGNLQQYAERYEPFRQAIKAKWPDVITIADTRVPHAMEIVDDHYYMSSGWFWAEADRYAKTKDGPKIYVGEYAVTHDPGKTGNLRAALGEAAFLCGLERSPWVVMASYAPLFVHVQDRKWNPDAIQFDGLRACGTPSYWAQVLFTQNRTDVALPCDVPAFAGEAAHGSIGLGTWNTQAEYKDIEVEVDGKVVYRSDFTKGAENWRAESGKWQVEGGAYRQSEDGDMRWARLDLPALKGVTDCVVRCKAKKIAGAEGFLLMFHVDGAADWTWFNVGGWGNKEHALERSQGGSKFGLGKHASGGVETGKWHDLRVECKAGRIRTFLDNAPVHDEQDRTAPNFTAAAGKVTKTGEVIVKVVNGSEQAREVELALAGAGPLSAHATGMLLTSASLDDENSLDEPTKVAAKAITVDGVASTFRHTFAPRSVTVLRLAPAAH